MFKFPLFLIFLVLLFPSIKAVALEVNDLYQVTVVVDSQSPEQREQAITSALQGVLLKVGGKESVLQHKVLARAQTKAAAYVNQYRYQRIDNVLSLVVSFNEQKVNELFKQADLSLWGSLRPQVLLWLIDEQGASRSIVAYDADTLIPTSVNDFSKQRGLPIVMPLMDLDDSAQVAVDDFWRYLPEQIQQASSRYFADMVIVMRVSDSSLVNTAAKASAVINNNVDCGLLCQDQVIETPVALDWKVYTQGTLYTQQYQGFDKVNLITQGLSDITELIYQSYALSTNAENDFVIEVNNVSSLKNDTQLLDFLSDLSAVKDVKLISAQGDVRRFQLELLGSQDSFLASLKLNNKLTQQSVPQVEIAPQADTSQIVPQTETSQIDSVEQIDSTFQVGDIPQKERDFQIDTDFLIENDEQSIDTEPKGLDIDDSGQITFRGLNVIVLGNTEGNTNLFEENSTQADTLDQANEIDSFHQNLEENIEGSSAESIAESIDTISDIDLANIEEDNADTTVNIEDTPNVDDDGSVTDEQLITTTEEQVPLTIVPNIPVFYWEQG